jgi:hypothetical protein
MLVRGELRSLWSAIFLSSRWNLLDNDSNSPGLATIFGRFFFAASLASLLLIPEFPARRDGFLAFLLCALCASVTSVLSLFLPLVAALPRCVESFVAPQPLRSLLLLGFQVFNSLSPAALSASISTSDFEI